MTDYVRLAQSPEGWGIIAGIFFLILVSNGCHEGGHALVAFWMGDRRAEIRRRATLNPIVHFHWLLSLVLPVLSVYFLGWCMGGARPVLINAGRIGRYRMALMALAGPTANFLFCGFVVVVLSLLLTLEWVDPINPIASPVWRIMKPAIWFSAFLGFINLIPFPPLDGSRVVGMFMSDRVRYIWYRLAPLGIIGLIVLMLWIGGVLQPYGFGRGHPELYMKLDNEVERAITALYDVWRAVL